MAATDVQVQSVSATQSLSLVKNMLRISISSIAFHRGLFPKSCFEKRDHGPNQPIVHILKPAEEETDTRQLLVQDHDAFQLTQWLEKGVFSAIEKGFLQQFKFAIFTKHPVTGEDLLLETYEFRLSYPTDTDPAKRTTINGAPLTKKCLKSQANKFVRSLIEFSETLDELPKSCWITLVLEYTDSTPADYEPEFFKEALQSLPGFEGNSYMKIKIGSLTSTHHDMSVKFVGLESLSDESLKTAICGCPVTPHLAVQGAGEVVSRSSSAFRGASMSNHADQGADGNNTPDLDVGVGPDPSLLSSSIKQMVIASECCLHTPSSVDNNDQGDVTTTALIRDYFIKHLEASIKDVARDLSLSDAVAKEELLRLAEEGFLKSRGRAKYVLQEERQIAPDIETQEEGTQMRQTRGSTGGKKRPVPSAPRKPPRDSRQQDDEEITDVVEEFTPELLAPAPGANPPKLALQPRSKPTTPVANAHAPAGSSSSSSSSSSAAAEAMQVDSASRVKRGREKDDQEVPASQNSDSGQITKKRSIIKDPIHVNRDVNRSTNTDQMNVQHNNESSIQWREAAPWSQ